MADKSSVDTTKDPVPTDEPEHVDVVTVTKTSRTAITTAALRKRTAWVVTAVLAVAAVGIALYFASGEEGVATVDLADLGATDRPVVVNEETLRAFAAGHEGAIYWAGPRADSTYELTLTDIGDVFIRYLPLGVPAGNTQPDFLTVATYVRPDAYQALVEVATGDRFVSEQTASGALVVSAAEAPTSAHFAFPDTQLQVEVFDPQPNRALSLVLDGSITLVR